MNNIKKARENAGMSQKEVAISLKVSAPTVSEWESGKKNPSMQNAMELSKLFCVPTDYLLGVSDEKPYPSYISKLICADVSNLMQDDSFAGRETLFIPLAVAEKIKNGTYSFSDVTFPQFEDLVGKSIDDYYLSYAKSAAARPITDEDIKFALFGGEGEITDAMYDEVKRFAQMVKLREEVEKKKE